MKQPSLRSVYTRRTLLILLSLFVFLFGAAAPAAGSDRSACSTTPCGRPSQPERPQGAVLQPLAPRKALTVQAGMPDPGVQALIDRVTPTLVYSYVAGLSGEQPVTIGGSPYTIQNRNTENRLTGGGEGLQHATRYAFERFTAAGLDASFNEWTTTYWTGRNVIGELSGQDHPGRLFLLVAHLDDHPIGTVAPGADDNASGSAAVLIASQLLGEFPCHRTLRFVLFTGEEQGLLGSTAYASQVADENIEGVLNLDMIGWESDDYPEVDLHARPGMGADLRIAHFFVNVVDAYGLSLVPEVNQDAMGRSDHASFWGEGFPAILAIEDLEDFNDHYHTPRDRVETLDLAYLTDFVKAAVGVAAHAACLVPGYVYLPVVK